MRRKTRLLRALYHQMSPEQYARKRHQTPYLYTLGSGETALTFIGANHTTDPHDKLFPLIDEALNDQSVDMVFVEGVQNIAGVAGTEQFINGLSETEAITRGGESVYTLKRALAHNIPWACPEPSDQRIARKLIESFYSREEIIAWYVLRLLMQYHRRNESVPFVAYVAPFLAQFKQATDWDDVAYTLEAALATAALVLRRPININNKEQAAQYTDPIPWPDRWTEQSYFNEMTRVVLAYRDQYIAKEIAKEILAGKRVVVVYGVGHAVMQEPIYRALLEDT